MSIKEISCENARFSKRSIREFMEHSTELSVCIKAGNLLQYQRLSWR